MSEQIREKLKLTKQEAQEIVWGDSDKFNIVEDTITSNGRWTINHTIIIKRLGDSKFFKDHYSVGATECQEERPFEYTEPNFTEVFPVEEKIIVYK